MSSRIEELDWCESLIGVIGLRRRHDPVFDVDEVKIDDEFLMSSLFTVVETELARLGLALVDGDDLISDVLTDRGVFGLWSDDPPAPTFEATLAEVFRATETHVVSFANPLTEGRSASTVYLASRPGQQGFY